MRTDELINDGEHFYLGPFSNADDGMRSTGGTVNVGNSPTRPATSTSVSLSFIRPARVRPAGSAPGGRCRICLVRSPAIRSWG